MPFKDKEKQREYSNEYRKRKRRERGLQKSGRKPYTEEEAAVANEATKTYRKIWKQEYFKVRPEKRLFWAATRRAKDRAMEFSIDLSDIVVPTHCPYLGIELVPHTPRGTPRTACITLDRINNQEGYVKGNVEVISHLANTMKNSATEEQLILFAEEVLKRLKS